MTTPPPPIDEGWEQRVQRLEEALRSREAILDCLPDHVVIQDEDHRILWANQAACGSLGMDRSAVVNRRCHELWGSQAEPCPDCPMPVAMKTGSPARVTKTTPDGRTWRIRCTPLPDVRGAATTMIEVTEEITERLRIQQRQQEAEENRKLMLDTMQEMLAYHDTELRVKWANRAAAESVDLEVEDLVGRHCYEIWQQRDTPCEGCPVIKAMESGQARESEAVTPDGRVYRIRGYPVVGDNGRLKGAVEYGLDITESKRAEEALEAQHAKLKSLFDYSGEAIVLLDTENRVQDANRAFEEVFGYSLQEARGEVIEHLICPERFYSESHRLDRQSLTVGGIKGVELIRKRKDGTEIHVRASAGPIKSGEEEIGLFVVFDDISARKRAEERIALMAGMLDEAPGSITVHDTGGRFLYANRKTFEMHGYNEDEFMAVNLYDLAVPESEALLEERFRRIAEHGEASFEVAHFRKDGTAFPLAVLAKSIEWQGKPAVLSIAADISERKVAEEALQRIRFSVENLTDTVIWVDENGHLTDVNEAACRRLGYSREELLTLCVADIDPHFPQERWPSHWEEMQRCGVMVIETEHRARNGDLIPMELVVHNQVFGNRRYNCVLGRDISERRKAEVEREKLEAQWRQSHKMEAVGTLAGGIAHDFNNILGIIVGNAELAMMDIPEWSPAQESLREVRQATLRARDLVTRILLFARRKEQVVSPIRVESIAKESLKMLRASIPSTVDIRQRIEENIPAVLADPSQIQQIIMNLCTNAAQVLEAEGGMLTFTVNAVVLDAPMLTTTGPIPEGRYVRLQVGDTGPGISPNNLERIFDPFFTTKGVGEGTGLGLAVVHGIVQGINGGIHVESREGQGTTFSVFLPASESEAPDEGEANETGLPRGNERILFVDDEPLILKLGRRILERQGYRVEDRASGIEALELFREDPDRFDLVITDMTMPGMRGDRLAEEIMALRPDTPVILCTGFSKQISEEKARAMGVRAFVMKPLTQGELTQTVRMVLDEKARQAPSP